MEYDLRELYVMRGCKCQRSRREAVASFLKGNNHLVGSEIICKTHIKYLNTFFKSELLCVGERCL